MAGQVPFKEGLLTTPLSPLESVRLKGIKCRACGSLALGESKYCINCTSKDVEEYVFSKYGKIYSYTVIRHAPPPPYPQESFKPFPVAWVELEDGLFIVSEITGCGLDELDFGMRVELELGKGWVDDKGNDVMMYKFKLIK
jgi:uncharacterized OB-fold protein